MKTPDYKFGVYAHGAVQHAFEQRHASLISEVERLVRPIGSVLDIGVELATSSLLRRTEHPASLSAPRPPAGPAADASLTHGRPAVPHRGQLLGADLDAPDPDLLSAASMVVRELRQIGPHG
ncbi:MAG: hypothetical protein KY440_04875 [Actinobacteria bacterium]|nr:hypothetical protein [Actinomycetota bacterium]